MGEITGFSVGSADAWKCYGVDQQPRLTIAATCNLTLSIGSATDGRPASVRCGRSVAIIDGAHGMHKHSIHVLFIVYDVHLQLGVFHA